MAGPDPAFTAISYLNYRLQAKDAFDIHSPFVFSLYNEVVKRSRRFEIPEIEAHRARLRKNHSDINNLQGPTTISKIARRSLSSSGFTAFLHLLVEWIDANSVLETGTSLGVSTAYLAYDQSVQVHSIEESTEIHDFASSSLKNLRLSNAKLINGTLQEVLIPTLKESNPDLIFLDADHRSKALDFCIHSIFEYCDPSVIIIHDIYWSKDMNQYWKSLVNNQKYPLTVDLFQAGILFPKVEMEKQHFVLKF